MMMDQYKGQYTKETEQIHAPAELIARTKAAMREEEARIRRELEVQRAGTEYSGLSAVSSSGMAPVGDKADKKEFDVRKWAYPLTAAAALLILVSVSVVMRGFKSGDMTMSETPAYDTAVEEESSVMSGGVDLDGGMAAAPIAETGNMSEEMAAAENEGSDTAGFSESAEETVAEEAGQQKFSETEKNMADDASAPAESGAQRSDTAEDENITIEKVVKKPDFCRQPGTETYDFEGQLFEVTEEGNGWVAYTETKDGCKYVIRGEAEDLETFLQTGYQKLLDQK